MYIMISVAYSSDRNMTVITPEYRIFLEKLTVTHVIKKYRSFMDSKYSLPRLQNPATVPCPDSLFHALILQEP
jgi:hypothetical protein